jgi:Uncharacterized protein, possibly involved in aromatic compounds catabolism
MDKEYQQIIDDIENSKFCQFLGLKISQLYKGGCEMHLPITDLLRNNLGVVDQKILFALCDIAGFAAACTLIPGDDPPAHYSIHATAFLPVAQNNLKIIAQATSAEVGWFIESKIWDNDGQLVAVGDIRF